MTPACTQTQHTAICPGDCSGNGKCSDTTNPPVCECLPYWGGPDCSRSEQRSSSGDDSATTYAALGGGLGGGLSFHFVRLGQVIVSLPDVFLPDCSLPVQVLLCC
jgi:hypothetical protein